MDFKQLEAYIKVYELQSFSKAAEGMFLSQPSVSAYVGSLEKEMGVQLIHRSAKEFVPTKAGKMFYEHAKEMLAVRDKSIINMRNIFESNTGSIDILASSVPAQYILPEMLGDFHRLYPNIMLNVEQADTTDVVKGVAAYRGEIGFVGAKIENPKCVYKSFMSEKLILIVPNEKRFEKINSNNAADMLKHEYFVIREAGSGTRLEYEQYLKTLGIKISSLKVSASFSNTQSIIHAVAGGLGVSIVSEIAAKQHIQHKMVLPVYLENMPQRNFYLVQKKHGIFSPNVEALIGFIRSSDKNKGIYIES
jgi:DNA-binding transcriptional LysR family regulator